MLQVLYKKACNQAKKMVDINDGVFIYFLQSINKKCRDAMHRISKRVRKKKFHVS